jgi:hypothetical protein
MTYCPAYVPVIVELWPDANKATANNFELQVPRTFYNNGRENAMWDQNISEKGI